jgi:hypothetical protein
MHSGRPVLLCLEIGVHETGTVRFSYETLDMLPYDVRVAVERHLHQNCLWLYTLSWRVYDALEVTTAVECHAAVHQAQIAV